MDQETKMVIEALERRVAEIERKQNAKLQDDFTAQQVVNRETVFNAAVYDASGTKVIN